jgi:hypothetical protein
VHGAIIGTLGHQVVHVGGHKQNIRHEKNPFVVIRDQPRILQCENLPNWWSQLLQICAILQLICGITETSELLLQVPAIVSIPNPVEEECPYNYIHHISHMLIRLNIKLHTASTSVPPMEM